MATSHASPSRWPVLPDIKLIPAVAHLPVRVHPERRNLTVRNAIPDRVHGEFREMPGLSLTLKQATKLFGVSADACTRILGQLTEARVLAVRTDGRYVLRAGQS